MAHVSLYRKYRPQTFAEIVGQRHITTTLANAVTGDKMHHAYLFTGPRGTGKTSAARILAKAVNCVSGPTDTPCNTCEHCQAITAGSAVDVIEIDAASHGGVDDVRDLRDRVAFAPANTRMKVYIVDECHMLSTAGWNAFLKTVEEPPGHVMFVFATTEPHKVLPTILSRTQRFDFKRIAGPELTQYLEQLAELESWELEPGAVDLVVRAGDGSARDTLSVMDQVVAFTGAHITLTGVAEVLGAVSAEVLMEMTDHMAAGDVAGVCTSLQKLADSGQDLRQFAQDLVAHLRELFLLKTAPDARMVEGTPEQLQLLTGQAQRIGQVELLRGMELLSEAMTLMRQGSARLPLEIALIKTALPEAAGDPGAIAARMDRLERRTGVDPTPAAVAPGEPTTQAPEPQVVTDAPAASAAPAAAPPEDTPTPPPTRTEQPQPEPAEPAAVQPPVGQPEPDADPTPDPAPSALAPTDAEGTGSPPAAPATDAQGAGSAPAAASPTDAEGTDPAPAAESLPDRPELAEPASQPELADDGWSGDGRGVKTETAAEAPPSAAPAQEVTIDLVRTSWPAVLESVKSRSRRLHAFLTPGHPEAVEGGELRVRFASSYAFHAEQCGSADWADTLGAVLGEVFGEQLRVTTTVDDSAPPTSTPAPADPHEQDHQAEASAVFETEAAEAAGELPDEGVAHQHALERLQRDLGARIIEDS